MCTHSRILTIEGWGNPNHVLNVVKKIGENNQMVGKINQIISQTPTLGPKHDKIQAQWALNILSERGMMVEALPNGILKSNHLLFGELFKQKKTCANWGNKSSHATLKCSCNGNLLQIWAEIFGQSKLAPMNTLIGCSVHGMGYILLSDS